MARIGVLTYDFKFYHDIIQLLREWNLPFLSIEEPFSVPGDVPVVLSSAKDDFVIENQVKAENPKEALRKSLSRLMFKDRFENLVIGIDPGPYPGVAVFGDNVLTEAYECASVDRTADEISSIVSSYHFTDLEIKIGDGDIPNRDCIINSLRNRNFNVKIVDEKNTSFPHKVHDNALSAARIAQIESQYVISNDLLYQNIKRKYAYEREFTTLKSIVG